MPSPLDAHSVSISEYLSWLNTPLPGSSGGSGGSGQHTTSALLTWKLRDYACSYSWTQGRFLDAGGLQNVDQLVLTLLETMDDPGPQVNDTIEFAGKTMRIQIIKLAAGKFPTLICWSPDKGA
jgi:hypothetical protein